MTTGFKIPLRPLVGALLALSVPAALAGEITLFEHRDFFVAVHAFDLEHGLRVDFADLAGGDARHHAPPRRSWPASAT